MVAAGWDEIPVLIDRIRRQRQEYGGGGRSPLGDKKKKKLDPSRIGNDLLCGAVSAAGSYKSVKQLLNVFNATVKCIESRLHIIEAAFYRHGPVFRPRRSFLALLWRQAANEMVLLSVLTGAAREFRYAL